MRDRWKIHGYWSEAYEPGVGSGTGYPDIQMLCPISGKLLPVELKVGEVVDGRVIPREVRGPQVVWHRELWLKGGTSVCAIGVEPVKDTWVSYFIEGPKLKDWEDGFLIEECKVVQELRGRLLAPVVDHYLRQGPLSKLALSGESVI